MRVLLVSPKAHTGGLEALRKGNQILQGLLFVAAAARDAGHKVTVVIADSASVDKYIRNYKPDLIGISCVTATYPVARDLIRHIRKTYPQTPVVMGGHHATFMYKEIFEETDIHYICRGEGEEVFVKLLASLEAGDLYPEIPGMVFRKDSAYCNEDSIAILDDLANLPKITMDLVAPEFSFSPKIVSSRGCPFHCSFCSISAFYGGRYRQRTVDAVIADIKDYLSWGFEQFWFHDDNLTVDKNWVVEFCNRVIEEKMSFRWNCMSRIDLIVKDPDMIALMAKAGCKLLSIGIESGIPEVIEKMHKKINLSDIDKAISILEKNKLSHNWYMILGSADEFDQHKYIRQNIKFFSSHRFGYVLISILTPLPGTELFNRLKAENRILHYNWEDYDITHCVYQPLGMTAKELESYLPKAYLQVYLSKGWRLIPMFIKSMRTGAMRPGMIFGGLRILIENKILGRDFNSAMSKRK